MSPIKYEIDQHGNTVTRWVPADHLPERARSEYERIRGERRRRERDREFLRRYGPKGLGG